MSIAVVKAASNSNRCSRKAYRSFASKMEKLATTSDIATTSPPIVELRQYQLHPSHASLYTQRTIQSAPLRKQLPLAFFGFPETGGMPLNTAVHVYHYPGGHVDRLERRSTLAKEDSWKQYLGEVKPCMMQQSSGIFLEAGLVNDFDEVKGLKYWVDLENCDGGDSEKNGISGGSSNGSIVELRKYQLKLGYDTVPTFLQLYSDALPSKLNAPGTHPTTQLVTILVSDVGTLNTVYEVWKHGGGISGNDTNVCGTRAMEQSRQASRGAQPWRKGIADIAELAVSFDTTILKPLDFSPLR